MAIDFAAIIADEKTYPDALEVPFGNEKIQLGAIRDLGKRQQKQIADKLSEINAERQQVATKQNEVLQLSEKATAIYNELQQKLEAANKAVPRNADGVDLESLFKSDPWYAPVRERYSAIEAQQKKLTETLDALTKSVQGAVSVWYDDRLDSEWNAVSERVKKSKAGADWDREKLLKYATDNGLVDKRKLPSLRVAAQRLLEGEDRQSFGQSEYERGLKEGEIRARLGAQPRPTSAAAALPGDSKQYKTIEEATSQEALRNDPELMEMLANLNSLQPTQLQ